MNGWNARRTTCLGRMGWTSLVDRRVRGAIPKDAMRAIHPEKSTRWSAPERRTCLHARQSSSTLGRRNSQSGILGPRSVKETRQDEKQIHGDCSRKETWWWTEVESKEIARIKAFVDRMSHPSCRVGVASVRKVRGTTLRMRVAHAL